MNSYLARLFKNETTDDQKECQKLTKKLTFLMEILAFAASHRWL